jgi:uncharacterized tellurite resistance protein B-like protein
MLKSVTEYIERIKAKGTSIETYSEEEISTAIASLFKQMVLSDGVIRDEEIESAVNHLVSKYGYLDKGETDQSIRDHFQIARNESMFPIAVIINSSLSKAQRGQLKIQLMSTALSDREFHPYEQDFMDLVDRLIKT